MVHIVIEIFNQPLMILAYTHSLTLILRKNTI